MCYNGFGIANEKEGSGMMYNIIEIERENASGGNEIGEREARWLGIPCYGNNLLPDIRIK